MKIKFLIDWKHQGTDYEKDDVKAFDDATGRFFCEAGVGEDMSGVVPTQEQDPGKSITLNVKHSNQNEVLTNG
mgnify:CR=1 FL=1